MTFGEALKMLDPEAQVSQRLRGRASTVEPLRVVLMRMLQS
jgi:hypothetical protein